MKPRTFCLTEGEAIELKTAYQHCQDARAKTRFQAAREAISHNHASAKLPTLAAAFETHPEQTRFACSLLDKQGYRGLCERFK